MHVVYSQFNKGKVKMGCHKIYQIALELIYIVSLFKLVRHITYNIKKDGASTERPSKFMKFA